MRAAARLAALACAMAAVAGVAARAQTAQPLPAGLQNVGLTQKLDAALPLDTSFVDEDGSNVALGDYFSTGRPVLLTLVYYRCPMLCNVVLQGLTDALRRMDWTPGEQFEIVTVSIDPRETPELARDKKRSILEAYGRPQAARGWHFLTGPAADVERLADAVGFEYEYLPQRGEYAHPAALYIVTPAGRISRYLLGVTFDPQTTRLSLVEAADGKIGTLADQFLLYCFRYDAESGRYTAVVWNIMRLGGLATLLVLGVVLALFWRRELRVRRQA